MLRKEQRKIQRILALSAAVGRGRQCVSHSHKKSFCFLFSKLAENRNRAKASETEMQSGVWNAGCPCPGPTFPQWDETPGSLLFLHRWPDSFLPGIHSFLNGVDSQYPLQSAPHCSEQAFEQWGLVLSIEQSVSSPIWLSPDYLQKHCPTYSAGKCACKVIPPLL